MFAVIKMKLSGKTVYGPMNIFPVYGMEMVWYGDGAGNTVEENSSVFSLV